MSLKIHYKFVQILKDIFQMQYAILKSSKTAPRASIKDYFAIYLSFFKTDVFPLGVFSIRNFNGNAPRAELHKPARPRSP